MESVTRRSTAEVLKPIIKFLIISGIITAIIYFFVWMAKKYRDLSRSIPTAENIARIGAELSAKYNTLYLQRRPATAASLNPADAPLINYNILGCRVAGYYGVEGGGVFSEDNAVKTAIDVGCRVFTLNISVVDSAEGAIVVARNNNLDLISLNIGSVRKVANALSRYAPINEPVIVFLYFDRLPSTTNNNHIKLMMDVATALEPLQNRHLGMTDSGDYRRQAMQDTLFLRNRSLFDGKFIILTNADTSIFRQSELNSIARKGLPAITPTNDLDLWVHGQVYSLTSMGLGITSRIGESRTTGPRIETLDYFMAVPENQQNTTVANSKVNWTIAMNPGVDNVAVPKEVLDKLLNKLGVSCIMVDIFRDDLANGILSNDYFGRSGWRLKPTELQYIRPDTIPLTQPNPQLNANGGFLQSPQT